MRLRPARWELCKRLRRYTTSASPSDGSRILTADLTAAGAGFETADGEGAKGTAEGGRTLAGGADLKAAEGAAVAGGAALGG